MKRPLRAAACVAASLLAAAGCDLSKAPAPTKVSTSAEIGPNRRLKFKDEYKQILGKDGQLLFKPSQSSKRPPGIPKS